MVDLEDVRQLTDHDCGAACACAILRYHGIRCTLAGCVELLYTNGLDGTDLRTLEGFFRSYGLCVLAGEMDLTDIRQQTRRGRPVLCLVTGHYVVALGLTRSRVHVHDPLGGRARLPVAAFEEGWRDTDRSGAVYQRFGLSVWKNE